MPEPRRDEEFYVGYLPAPPGLAAFALRVVGILGLLLLGASLGLVSTQSPFAAAVFEFGQVRHFEGVLTTFPHPMLRVPRPGGGESLYYLVAPGKFGVAEQSAALDGHRVGLDGTLIYRSDQTMIELVPESLADLGPAPGSAAPRPLGTWRLEGEIVDSKCFLGVMNPGNLKPHRACATRCISGGIPPILLVREADGLARHLLLVGPEGEAINQEVLQYVAEPVAIEGEVVQLGDRLVLKADPAEIQRL
ncbi:MAG: hypothetical protein H6741_20120 [Alphaproteobacteria bacterium]|nr:hypothetical protein [Alphaproteobacteria bacterium]